MTCSSAVYVLYNMHKSTIDLTILCASHALIKSAFRRRFGFTFRKTITFVYLRPATDVRVTFFSSSPFFCPQYFIRRPRGARINATVPIRRRHRRRREPYSGWRLVAWRTCEHTVVGRLDGGASGDYGNITLTCGGVRHNK